MVDNTTQEARILTNDLNNVATAAAAASTHLNSITSNNTSHNITNANIQARVRGEKTFICKNSERKNN